MPVEPDMYPGFQTAAPVPQPDYRNEAPEAIAERLRSSGFFVAGRPSAVEQSDFAIPGPARDIPARLYRPSAKGPLPVVLSFHGGGWVMGSLEIDDARNLQLAELAHCAIVSVDYCLAPEHPFPAPLEEAYASLLWLAAHAEDLGCDPGRLSICGGSAGGNLAAAVALMARDRGGPEIGFQLLYYPVCGPDFGRASYVENGEGYGLTADAMRWFWDQYVPSTSDRENPYAAPIRADSLDRLPPALIVTAQYDPLRDEGKAYADRLQDHGVEAEFQCCEGLLHGFLTTHPYSARSREVIELSAAALHRALVERPN